MDLYWSKGYYEVKYIYNFGYKLAAYIKNKKLQHCQLLVWPNSRYEVLKAFGYYNDEVKIHVKVCTQVAMVLLDIC